VKFGLMLPLGEDDGVGRALTWQEIWTLAMEAEGSGLDSIAAPDHLVFHGKDEGVHGIHECWTLLAALGAITERVAIIPLVLAVPFRNPALTAKMAAELDAISDGRFVLGLGCGWHEPEFNAYDYPFDHRVGRFEEALNVMLPLVKGDAVRFEGRWHRADTRLLPPPHRPGGPPVLIAGKGDRMLRLVAQHADWWNAAWYGPPQQATELAERIARVRAACEAQGRDPATLTLTAGVFVHFPEFDRPGDEEAPESSMRGTVDEVGAMLAGYRMHSVEHLIVHLWPRRPEAVQALGRAADIARGILGDARPVAAAAAAGD
jgi:probable F420-dependent oxidoreductase